MILEIFLLGKLANLYSKTKILLETPIISLIILQPDEVILRDYLELIKANPVFFF